MASGILLPQEKQNFALGVNWVLHLGQLLIRTFYLSRNIESRVLKSKTVFSYLVNLFFQR